MSTLEENLKILVFKIPICRMCDACVADEVYHLENRTLLSIDPVAP